MLLITSDYPAIFRRKQVLNIILTLDVVFLPCLFQLLIEPQQDPLSQEYSVVILLEAYKVDPSIINWEYLPVMLDLHFQLSTQVKRKRIQHIVQSRLAPCQHHYIIHVPVVVFHAQILLNPVVEVCQV